MAELKLHNEPAGLTPLECEVILCILEGSDPDLEVLRRQVASATAESRSDTGVGFFTQFTVDPQSPRIARTGRFTLGYGVAAELPTLEHGAGFVLFIDKGAVDFLEGFTYDEPWPSPITEFKVRKELPKP